MRSDAAKQLTKTMRSRGLSQGDVARLVDVYPATVCRWVSGQRRPSVTAAVRLRDELGIPIEAWH